MGLFEKAAGGRGGAPLMFTPEVSLTFMKILLNYCFCYWGDDFVEIHSPHGYFENTRILGN